MKYSSNSSILASAAYCVVAVEAVGRQVPIAFLERVKDDFNKRYGGGKAATAVAHSLNKEFGYLYTSLFVHFFLLHLNQHANYLIIL